MPVYSTKFTNMDRQMIRQCWPGHVVTYRDDIPYPSIPILTVLDIINLSDWAPYVTRRSTMTERINKSAIIWKKLKFGREHIIGYIISFFTCNNHGFPAVHFIMRTDRRTDGQEDGTPNGCWQPEPRQARGCVCTGPRAYSYAGPQFHSCSSSSRKPVHWENQTSIYL